MPANKAPKNTMSPSEIKSLQDEKAELESTIRELEDGAGDGTRGSGIDKNALKKQVAYLDQKIGAGSPQRITGASKDKLAERARQLEEKIKEGMPSEDQMRRPGRYPGIVRANLSWQRRNTPLISEYKQIMRQLEPGDPTASSVERLRKRG